MSFLKILKSRFRLDRPLSYRAPVFFFLFLISDSLLSYSPLSLQGKLFVGILGLCLPFGIGFSLIHSAHPRTKDERGLWKDEFLTIPAWFWFLAVSFFIFLHFYGLGSIPFWLNFDEGTEAQYALELTRNWNWDPVMPMGMFDSGSCWLLAVLFKFGGVSFFSIRLFPAILFTASTAAAYWAARKFFSRSLSFLAVCFLGFSFWGILLGRFCNPPVAMLWMECLTLGILGVFMNNVLLRSKFRNLLILVFMTTLGFYTYTAWVAFAFVITVTVYKNLKGIRGRSFFLFLLILLAGIAPWFAFRMHPGGWDHIADMIGSPAVLDYFAALFWNGSGNAPFGPCWGGILNPLFAALVLIGFLELYGARNSAIARWMFYSLFIFFLPGALSSNLEIYRILLIFPILMVLASVGCRALLLVWSPQMKIRAVMMFALLGVSAVLDAYHYFGPTQDLSGFILNKGHWMAIDYARAYRILEKGSAAGKTFRPLLNLNNKNNDWTLDLALYPYDCLRNPKLHPDTKSPFILLVNSNYELFLLKAFPGSRWIWLSPDLPSDGGGFMLGILPATLRSEKMLEHWTKADMIFRENNRLYSRGRSRQILIQNLKENYGFFKGDPFLESVFWAKIAFYEFGSGHQSQAVDALENGVQKGWPTAYFYNELGVLTAQSGDIAKARIFFQKALQSPLNRTSALENSRSISVE